MTTWQNFDNNKKSHFYVLAWFFVNNTDVNGILYDGI